MYETILIPTDGSGGSLAAATHAIDLARTYGASLHVLYVVDVRMSPVSTGMDREAVLKLVRESDRDPTGAIVERAEAAGVETVEVIEVGVPYKVIGEYSSAHDVDLIVMGTHGRTGLEHTLLGSVAERVIRTVDLPVLTAPVEDDRNERAE